MQVSRSGADPHAVHPGVVADVDDRGQFVRGSPASAPDAPAGRARPCTPSRNRAPPTPPTRTVTFTSKPTSVARCAERHSGTPAGWHCWHSTSRATLLQSPNPPSPARSAEGLPRRGVLLRRPALTSRGSPAGRTAGRSADCGTRTPRRSGPPAPAVGRRARAPAASGVIERSAEQRVPDQGGMWKSPTLTASGSPQARCATSAAVQMPMPGTRRSSRGPARRPVSRPLQPVRHRGSRQDRAAPRAVDARRGATPSRASRAPPPASAAAAAAPARGPGAGSPKRCTAPATSGGPRCR